MPEHRLRYRFGDSQVPQGRKTIAHGVSHGTKVAPSIQAPLGATEPSETETQVPPRWGWLRMLVTTTHG